MPTDHLPHKILYGQLHLGRLPAGGQKKRLTDQLSTAGRREKGWTPPGKEGEKKKDGHGCICPSRPGLHKPRLWQTVCIQHRTIQSSTNTSNRSHNRPRWTTKSKNKSVQISHLAEEKWIWQNAKRGDIFIVFDWVKKTKVACYAFSQALLEWEERASMWNCLEIMCVQVLHN